MPEKLLIDILAKYGGSFSKIESDLWVIMVTFGAFTSSFVVFLGFYIYSVCSKSKSN